MEYHYKTKREYLIYILNLNEDDYPDTNSIEKMYDSFMKKLNFEKYPQKTNSLEEEIFVFFYKNKQTLAGIGKKEKGKTFLLGNIKYLRERAMLYYKKEIWPQLMSELDSIRLKEREIHMSDSARINGIAGCEKLESILENFKQNKSYLNNNLMQLTCMIFAPCASPFDKKGDKFAQYIDDEIKSYKCKIKVYNENNNPNIYTGINQNPWKNMYIYYISSYIHKFYNLDDFEFIPNQFFTLKNFPKITKKPPYSLADIADIYNKFAGIVDDNKKTYEKIKKQFQKSKRMQEYKKNNTYQFHEFELPIAIYEYYRKKNHTEPAYDDNLLSWMQADEIIIRLYFPLLAATVQHRDVELQAYSKYLKFLNIEFKQLFTRTDDAYISTFWDILAESPLRIINKFFEYNDE